MKRRDAKVSDFPFGKSRHAGMKGIVGDSWPLGHDVNDESPPAPLFQRGERACLVSGFCPSVGSARHG